MFWSSKPDSTCPKPSTSMGHVTLVAITGTIKPAPYLLVNTATEIRTLIFMKLNLQQPIFNATTLCGSEGTKIVIKQCPITETHCLDQRNMDVCVKMHGVHFRVTLWVSVLAACHVCGSRQCCLMRCSPHEMCIPQQTPTCHDLHYRADFRFAPSQ